MAHFRDLPLRTSRLLLRPSQPGDAAAVLGLYADPLVMRYWSTPAWPAMAFAQAAIEQDIAAFDCGEYLRLAIERRSDGVLIGQCSLFNLAPASRRAEIGYALASAAWGAGCMSEALQALLRYGFEVMDLNRIEAETDPRNAASVRTLLRLGFALEGTLRERWIVDGEVSDSGMYGLLRGQWAARSQYF